MKYTPLSPDHPEQLACFSPVLLDPQRTVRTIVNMRPTLLPDDIEILNHDIRRGQFRSVLFDFDGTLSLIREGWPQVMIPMMVEALQETGTTETPEQLAGQVEEFVMRLNGRQTIYQMMQLADEVKKRGGMPC